MNVVEFNRELREWPDKVAMEQAAQMQRNIMTDLSQGFIDATPVAPARYRGAGHAKRNWRVELHRALAATERTGVDPTGGIVKSEAAEVIARIKDRPVPFATISNPIDWSRQAWFGAVIARVAVKYARVR